MSRQTQGGPAAAVVAGLSSPSQGLCLPCYALSGPQQTRRQQAPGIAEIAGIGERADRTDRGRREGEGVDEALLHLVDLRRTHQPLAQHHA
eukprot:1020954-Rhodomonas_salina.1